MTDALTKVSGVEAVEIDLDKHTATVRFDEAKTGAEQLAAAIRDAGYTPS